MRPDMQDVRRFKLRLLLRNHFGDNREKFLEESGFTKGRLSQLLDPNATFGERAARNLEERLANIGIQPGYFDTLDERTMHFAMAFERLPAPVKEQWEQLAAMLSPKPPP